MLSATPEGGHGLAGVTPRLCLQCNGPIDPDAPPAQKYCQGSCRSKAYRRRSKQSAPPIIHPDLHETPPPWPHHEVPIAVVAHPKRSEQAEALSEKIHAEAVIMDHPRYPDGHFVNHLRAWSWLSGGNCPWSVVLEDDAVPLSRPPGTQSFRWQLHAALKAARSPVVSLYLGTSHPSLWQSCIALAVGQTHQRDACFFTSPYLLHGVGYAVRTELIPDLLKSITPLQHTLPIDAAVSLWCRARSHTVSYTWPSLVDHADGPSLIPDRDRSLPRRAWCVDSRASWEPTALPLPLPEPLREMGVTA